MLTENILDSSCLESLGEWQQWAGHGIRTSYLGVSVTPVPCLFYLWTPFLKGQWEPINRCLLWGFAASIPGHPLNFCCRYPTDTP